MLHGTGQIQDPDCILPLIVDDGLDPRYAVGDGHDRPRPPGPAPVGFQRCDLAKGFGIG